MADLISLRTSVAAAPAVAVVMASWAMLEEPVSTTRFVAAAALAVLLAALRDVRWRLAGCVVAAAAGLAVAFATWPHRALVSAWDALRDAPVVQAPFDPAAFASLHGLVVVAALGLALVASLGVAARRPAVVAGALAAGVGFPELLLEGRHAVLLGGLALGSLLWATVVQNVDGARRTLVGAGLAAALVAASGGAAVAGLGPGASHVDWRGWDPFAPGGGTTDVRFLWDASYSGIDFPVRPTVVLRVRAPARAEYWRMSTLETFSDDRWIENLFPTDIGDARRRLPADPLVGRRDARPGAWLEQKVTIEGLEDTRVPAAAEPARIDGPELGDVSFLEGGVILAHRPLRRGTRYTVWSYAPRPTPRALAASPPRYPAAAGRYLEMGRARFPGYGSRGRVARVDRVFRDELYQPLWAYRPLWQDAARLTAKARSPYEATLVLERWFRSGGGFRYEEHPPVSSTNPPLVDFVEVTRAGYCQHYAGAMAVMLRMLGIPSRVAVGFTAGTWKAGVWTVTDQQAHAWVEAWFAGFGWLAFDPTPGRGTLSAVYTLASDSADAVRALGTGRFLDFDATPSGRSAPPPVNVVPPDSGKSFPLWILLVVGLPTCAAAVIVGAKRARRTMRLRPDDPRRLAAGVRAELVSALLDRGATIRRDATPAELRQSAERILATPAGALAEALAEARYGPPSRARAAAARARGELARVLAAAAERETPGDHVRAIFSLRSLRPGSTARSG
ncbi:transglutaminaseTgpA domain-containing protein [Gaiella sp.]|uniref:transglutaminase family protein n=1 Tax=Gaiella sp. TaxID=2663207 RepID=UPI002C6A2F23|nr:transglutaminaseTgpA domain-containing protein [Gaiella sp.]HWO79072.1 transglutaminaseTgpA domain-containing protein [Gaiella sp.]